jgi:hypothetical protein
MRKLILLALAGMVIASLGRAQPAAPTTVQVININSQIESTLQNALGFPPANPFVEVLIVNPSTQADGYRIHVTYTDPQGVSHDVLRDVIPPSANDGRPIMEIFWIDAATVSATATPYKLQLGAVSSR